MTDKRRFSGGYDARREIHTAGGMAEPASPTGPSEDGADLASTDMSAEPSSREPDTRPIFGEGQSGLPAEPAPEAIRRLESQLDE